MSLETERGVHLYLDLMKQSLMNTLYYDYEYRNFLPSGKIKLAAFNLFLIPFLHQRNAQILERYKYEKNMRMEGRDWSPMAKTMIGCKRLDNLQHCVEQVIKNNIPGDLIETGVWRGGATIFMRAILKAYGISDRKVWVADSFEGLPKPNADIYPQDKEDRHHSYKELSISLEEVRKNFLKYELLDEQVCFLKGWFKDTLKDVSIKKLAVARLDGDMYESTMDALNNLYPKISSGGFLIVDDYGAVKGCAAAVHDFRKNNGVKEEIMTIDWTGIYWQKSRSE